MKRDREVFRKKLEIGIEMPESYAYYVRTFLDWCDLNDEPVDPTTQRTLLRFLHSNSHWSHGSAVQAVNAVVWVERSQGHGSPAGAQVTAYLQAVARDKGTSSLQQTDYIPADAVREIARRMVETPQPEDLGATRALVAAALAMGLDPRDWRNIQLVRHRAPEALTCADTGVNVQTSLRGEVTICQTDSPRMVAAIRAAMASGWDFSNVLNCKVANLAADVARRFHIAGTPGAEWWIQSLDKERVRRGRDLAYLLVGIDTARRHSELSRLRIRDIRTEECGFGYTLHDHKGNRVAAHTESDLQPIIRSVVHLADQSGECPPQCAACALAVHLGNLRNMGLGDNDFLFPKDDLISTMPVGAGSTIVQRALKLVADQVQFAEGSPLGTRMLRVTGATLARQAGVSLPDIAENVTGHRTARGAARYVRGNDPDNDPTISLFGP